MIERQGILEQVQSDINKLLLNLKTGKYLWKAAQRISVSDSGLGLRNAQTKLIQSLQFQLQQQSFKLQLMARYFNFLLTMLELSSARPPIIQIALSLLLFQSTNAQF